MKVITRTPALSLRFLGDLGYLLAVYRIRAPAFLAVACGAMFRLNRYARSEIRYSRERDAVYDLKNRFVRMLYEFGYCESVIQQEQVLYCWTCNGRGEVQDFGGAESCWKCNGSGEYRRHTLYRFTFNVLGTHWIWHQPSGLVSWSVQLTGETPDLYDRPPASHSPGMRRLDRDILIVWLALRFAQNPNLVLPGISHSDESYRFVPFPRAWFRRTRWVELKGLRRLRWNMSSCIRRLRFRYLRDDDIPF